jgi:hypothetical protein
MSDAGGKINTELSQEENMAIVRWVWIALNIILVIYGIALFIYAKYFRKNDLIQYVSLL